MEAPNLLKRSVNNIWLTVIILAVCAGISIYLLVRTPAASLNLWFIELNPEQAKIFTSVGFFILGLVIAGAINLLTSFIQNKKEPNGQGESQVIVPPIKIENIINPTPVAPSAPVVPSVNQKFYPAPFLPDLKFFVGRKELLKQIKAALKKGHRAAIHDISGLGKTFTTYKFVHDNQADYQKIFFIRATREEMLESLAKCGEMVEPGLANTKKQEDKALGFKKWLEENENWLVIYDNVDLPDELFKYVPVSKKGDCLFTSNFRYVRNLGTEISIVKLDKADAEILLYSRARHSRANRPLAKPDLDGDERAAFDHLIEEIDGLPLTLNSTGALIDKKQCSFADMWQRYDRWKEILWDSEDDYSVYQRRSASIVFSLAYDELCGDEKTGNLVKTVLDSMSFLSPDEIPEDLLKQVLKAPYRGSNGFLERIKRIASKVARSVSSAHPDDLWDSVRGKLTDYDLLKYDRQKKTFTTHRAIQRVIQSKIKGSEKDICIALALVLRGLFPEYDYSNRDECDKYYQHVLILLENSDQSKAETIDTNELYLRAGRYQWHSGNYNRAEEYFGREHPNYAIDLGNLARVYEEQGIFEQALDLYGNALRIFEKTLPEGHPNIARLRESVERCGKLVNRVVRGTSSQPS